MTKPQIVIVLVLIQLTYFSDANKHTYGDHLNYDYNMRRYFYRTVIDDVNKVPKHYTLIYKYFGSRFKDVQYFEIDINAPSSGRVDCRNNEIDANIEIQNAYNVTATISIFGTLPANLPRYVGFPKSDYTQKSLTFVYVKNAFLTQTNTTKMPTNSFENSIGNRRKGDELIHFESRNIRNKSRFPSSTFEYSGDEYITYVGFSFNSSTAIALVNTTYVGEQEFNAAIYDLNTDHFVANVSVYGIRGRRPDGFVGVI